MNADPQVFRLRHFLPVTAFGDSEDSDCSD
jgi:hypothetical protein